MSDTCTMPTHGEKGVDRRPDLDDVAGIQAELDRSAYAESALDSDVAQSLENIVEADEMLLEAALEENQQSVVAQRAALGDAKAPASIVDEHWEELYRQHEAHERGFFHEEDVYGFHKFIRRCSSAEGMALLFMGFLVMGVFAQIIYKANQTLKGRAAAMAAKSRPGALHYRRTGLGWGQGSGAGHGSSKKGRGKYMPEKKKTQAETSLLVLLRELKRANVIYERKKILLQIKERETEFKQLLAEILTDQESLYLLPAIQAASYLGLANVSGSLAFLAYSTDLRVAAEAVKAYEKLRGWTDAELQNLMDKAKKDDAFLLVVAGILAKRPKKTAKNLIALLTHKDPRIRGRAITGLGKLSDPADITRLCRFARRNKGYAAMAAVNALGLAGISKEVEACLYDVLQAPDEMLRTKTLEALGHKKSPLARPELILRVLDDPRMSVHTTATALAAFETTKTLPVAELKRRIGGMHPVLQLLAARCIIKAGDKTAIPVLIELLKTKVSKAVHFEEQTYARITAWNILAELSGKDFGMNTREWRKWYEEFGDLPEPPLKSKPSTTW